jgi:DNA-binding LacI/PurR family transcriptional regulator
MQKHPFHNVLQLTDNNWDTRFIRHINMGIDGCESGVSEPVRKRVMEAVQATGYQPSELARGLRRVKSNMIGMIIPDITNPFFPAVVRGAEDVAFSNGYRLILCNTDNDHSKDLVHLNELRT